MSRFLCLLFLVPFLVGCTRLAPAPHPTPHHVSAAEELRDEEYAVYATLIEGMYVEDKVEVIVIEDHTSIKQSISANLSEELRRVQRNVPALSQETFDDFQAKNKRTYPLNQPLELRIKYVLIKEEEAKEIYQDGDGWYKFYKKYPKSQGIMTLSKVGFNSEMNQALVYVGNQSGGLGGAGYLVFLSKENNKWTIKDKHGAWVS